MPSHTVMAAVLGMLVLLGSFSCKDTSMLRLRSAQAPLSVTFSVFVLVCMSFWFVWGILHNIGWVWVIVPNAFCSGFTAVYALVFGCHS